MSDFSTRAITSALQSAMQLSGRAMDADAMRDKLREAEERYVTIDAPMTMQFDEKQKELANALTTLIPGLSGSDRMVAEGALMGLTTGVEARAWATLIWSRAHPVGERQWYQLMGYFAALAVVDADRAVQLQAGQAAIARYLNIPFSTRLLSDLAARHRRL